MKQTLAIITIGTVPDSKMLPILNGHLSEEQHFHMDLLGNMSRENVVAEYGALPGEEQLPVVLEDKRLIYVGYNNISKAMQNVIEQLDNQGYDIIFLLSALPFHSLVARHSLLLESNRIVAPLVAAIVGSHQSGMIIPQSDLLKYQHQKWQILQNAPLYELAHPLLDTAQELIKAGQKLLNRGADVLVLDYCGFQQKHRDMLQNHFNVPVLLSYVMAAKLVFELLT